MMSRGRIVVSERYEVVILVRSSIVNSSEWEYDEEYGAYLPHNIEAVSNRHIAKDTVF